MNEAVIDGGAPALASEPAQPAAAQPNAATTQAQTDGAEGGEGQSGAQKTFTQQELDEIVQKRIAKAEAKAERRVLRTLERLHPQSAPAPAPQQPANDGKPTRAQFPSDEAYVDALTDWKLDQRDRTAATERQQQQTKSLNQKTESIYAEAEKLQGFDREAFDELPLTKAIVEALIDADKPAALMHYLAANPAEVERIAQLSPARQAAEIGKLEAKAAAAPPKSSSAPAPIKPLASGSGSGSTDPNEMSMDQYEKWRAKQGRG